MAILLNNPLLLGFLNMMTIQSMDLDIRFKKSGAGVR